MRKTVFQNGFVGIALAAMVVAAFSAASCASTGGGVSKGGDEWNAQTLYPPPIHNWIKENPGAYYGVGVHAMDGSESYSINQARTKALGDLTLSVEVSAAHIGKNYEEKGGAVGSEATKTRAANVLRGARTVGPVKANGQVYILQYIPRGEFDQSMKEAALESRAKISEAELDNLLDEAAVQSRPR